jgi:hypothetical protein
MHRRVQQQAPSESVSNAPSETTEARSDRDKEVMEFLQREVDPALLTSSRSSGPAVRRGRPGKVDKSKKVLVLYVISCDTAQHDTCMCAAVVQSSSSSAAGDRSRRSCSSSTCLQPAGDQDREAEVRAGQYFIFRILGIIGTFLKFWEILGNSEIDT